MYIILFGSMCIYIIRMRFLYILILVLCAFGTVSAQNSTDVPTTIAATTVPVTDSSTTVAPTTVPGTTQVATTLQATTIIPTTIPATTIAPTTSIPITCDPNHTGSDCKTAIALLHVIIPFTQIDSDYISQLPIDLAHVFQVEATRFTPTQVTGDGTAFGSIITVLVTPSVGELTPNQLVAQIAVLSQLDINPLEAYSTTSYIDSVVGISVDSPAIDAANAYATSETYWNQQGFTVNTKTADWVYAVISILCAIILIMSCLWIYPDKETATTYREFEDSSV